MREDFPEIIDNLMNIARSEAHHVCAEAIEPVHLFIAVCKQNIPPIQRALEAVGLDPVRLRRRMRSFAQHRGKKTDGEPTRVSSRVLAILQASQAIAENEKHPLTPCEVFRGLLTKPDADLSAVIEGEEIPISKLDEILKHEAANLQPIDLKVLKPQGRSIIDTFGKDYTAMAKEGKFDPIIGRRDEIKQIVRVLLRKQKNNPVLLGDAGVGKTSLVEGLAVLASLETSPKELREMRIVEIQTASLVAGTKFRGDFEERLQQLIQETEQNPKLVIFFDEIHTLVGTGSGNDAMDASNILKPALAKGNMRCIGATTVEEYSRHIEKDPALERRFQPIRIDEPTPEDTRKILEGLRPTYEKYHEVQITDEALDAAVFLSVRYITDRRLPDKARDLVDQASVNKRFLTFTPSMLTGEDKPKITADDIASVVAEWTGIPVARLSTSRQEHLKNIGQALRQRVIGQDAAIDAVSKVVLTVTAGLSNPNRPLGVFLFIGPTGVGKTELAKALAEFLFNDEDRLFRFDMSEFQEEHSIAKLIGSPPGYVGYEEGGRLTDAVRRTPYCIILFDEVEKAHPKVFDLFLQIFDEGRLTDSHGRLANFRNSIIILTSNINVGKHNKAGFIQEEKSEQDNLRESLLSVFRPELLNRISNVVSFQQLSKEHVRAIIDKILDNVRLRGEDRQIDLVVSANAYEVIMSIGYSQEFGVRELERVIEREIVQPLAASIISGDTQEGKTIYIIARDGRITLSDVEEDDIDTSDQSDESDSTSNTEICPICGSRLNPPTAEYPEGKCQTCTVQNWNETIVRNKKSLNIPCEKCGVDLTQKANSDGRYKELLEVTSYVCQDCVTKDVVDEYKSWSDFGKYTVIDLIGVGGMGEVYKVYHPETARIFALKRVINIYDDQFAKRFIREIDLLSNVLHKNVLRFIETDVDDSDHPFLITEYVPNGSFDELIKLQGGKLSINEALPITLELLDGLDFLHKQSIIHRDIKPKNILLRQNNNAKQANCHYVPKLADFGIAFAYSMVDEMRMTQSNQRMGTLKFASPEQLIDARNVTESADIYSVSATLYYALTGSYCFNFTREGRDIDPLFVVLESQPISIIQRDNTIPQPLAEVIDKGISKEPSERYQSAEELYNSLANFYREVKYLV